ncbi:unnamed protein product [Protopolystoma xenopodis]|uniref:Uncharacterized protein n=1 Tax=Protopolystoma xenopodis TaxID=117903 RepID=A0A448WEM0_9PLAT|nr:unnamed protein product [Protopolystoma xenopodis]
MNSDLFKDIPSWLVSGGCGSNFPCPFPGSLSATSVSVAAMAAFTATAAATAAPSVPPASALLTSSPFTCSEEVPGASLGCCGMGGPTPQELLRLLENCQLGELTNNLVESSKVKTRKETSFPAYFEYKYEYD